jgi:hypothetical protein
VLTKKTKEMTYSLAVKIAVLIIIIAVVLFFYAKGKMEKHD